MSPNLNLPHSGDEVRAPCLDMIQFTNNPVYDLQKDRCFCAALGPMPDQIEYYERVGTRMIIKPSQADKKSLFKTVNILRSFMVMS